MYVVVVYDVAVERVNKVCKYLRTRLNWVQNSVFEGELTKAELVELELGLGDLIDKEADSILFYLIRSQKALTRKKMGVEKVELDRII